MTTTSLQTKCPADFSGPVEWRTYVAETFPPEERKYALVSGRTTMFLRFYELRKQPFPAEFNLGLDRLKQLPDQAKTDALEALNGRIFAHMIQFLAEAAPQGSGTIIEASPRETVTELIEYIGKKNPWFALWVRYSNQESGLNSAGNWEEYVHQELNSAEEQEIQFTLLMGQMGRLLDHFRNRNLALPPHYFQRIWFLHNIRGAERNPQARALVHGLLEAMASCTSA